MHFTGKGDLQARALAARIRMAEFMVPIAPEVPERWVSIWRNSYMQIASLHPERKKEIRREISPHTIGYHSPFGLAATDVRHYMTKQAETARLMKSIGMTGAVPVPIGAVFPSIASQPAKNRKIYIVDAMLPRQKGVFLISYPDQ